MRPRFFLLLLLVLAGVGSARAQDPTPAWQTDTAAATLLGERAALLPTADQGLVRFGDCTAVLVSATGLATTPRSCIRNAGREAFLAAVSEQERLLDQPGVVGGDTLSVRLVYLPEQAVAEFGGAGYPSYRIDFALIRLYDGEGARESPVHFDLGTVDPVHSDSVVALTADRKATGGPVSGYPFNGTLAQPRTLVFGLLDRHWGMGDSDLPDGWVAALSRMNPTAVVSFNARLSAERGAAVLSPNLELLGMVVAESDRGSVVFANDALLGALGAAPGAARLLNELKTDF